MCVTDMYVLKLRGEKYTEMILSNCIMEQNHKKKIKVLFTLDYRYKH